MEALLASGIILEVPYQYGISCTVS